MLDGELMYMIGIYDPKVDNSWPWHFHYERGVYLSDKKRRCGDSKAAKFKSKPEAEQFYSSWNGSKKFDMELIEVYVS